MEEKKLTDYQVEILEEVVGGSIEAIHYRTQKTMTNNKVQNKLEGIMKGKSLAETRTALESLENDFGILRLDPLIKVGLFLKCWYRVLDKAKELYNSYLEEKGPTGSY